MINDDAGQNEDINVAWPDSVLEILRKHNLTPPITYKQLGALLDELGTEHNKEFAAMNEYAALRNSAPAKELVEEPIHREWYESSPVFVIFKDGKKHCATEIAGKLRETTEHGYNISDVIRNLKMLTNGGALTVVGIEERVKEDGNVANVKMYRLSQKPK